MKAWGVVLTFALIVMASCAPSHPPPKNTDHFTDSRWLQADTEKALYVCYNVVKRYAKTEPDANPYEVYWRCLFRYGVVI